MTAGVGVVLGDRNLDVPHASEDVLRNHGDSQCGSSVPDHVAARAKSGVDCCRLEKVELPTVEGSLEVPIPVSEFKLDPVQLLSRVWILEVAQTAFKALLVFR